MVFRRPAMRSTSGNLRSLSVLSYSACDFIMLCLQVRENVRIPTGIQKKKFLVKKSRDFFDRRSTNNRDYSETRLFPKSGRRPRTKPLRGMGAPIRESRLIAGAVESPVLFP